MKKITITLFALLFVLVVHAQNKNEVFNVNGVSFEMVFVKGGTFWMGIPNSDPDADPDYVPYPDERFHKVTLSDYYIGKFEVTQKLWKAVMGNENNPSYNKKGGNYPVEKVSWDDCQEFIEKLNRITGRTFALPTEAQWEFAARGGIHRRDNSDRTPFYKYSGSSDIDAVAWYEDNSGSQTHGVGRKQPNELGIYDMSGNVYEWCLDWYAPYGAGPDINPAGPAQGYDRVLRGGSWITDFSSSCSVTKRKADPPHQYGERKGYYYKGNYGFRLALLP